MKPIRQIVGLILFFLAFVQPLCAQPGDFPGFEEGEGNEKIETLRIAFLSRKLNLTTEEAQKFWPVYNAFRQEQKTTNSSLRHLQKGMKNGLDAMSNEEVTKFTDEFVAVRRKEAEIFEKYHKQLKQVLPIRKIAILYRAEKEFKQELLREMKARREGTGIRRN